MKFNEPYIVAEYLTGRNTKDLANELGTYNTSVRRILLRNGITPRDASEAQRKTVNMFNSLESEDAQYWLGFLAADGAIAKAESSVSLGVADKDLAHLKKYAEFVGVKHMLHVKHTKNHAWGYRVSFKNKLVKQTLISYGVTPAKSYTLELQVPLTWHIFRGIFDGDGYTRATNKTCVSIEICTASDQFKLQLSTFLISEGIHHSVRTLNRMPQAPLHLVAVYKKSEAIKVAERMYKDAHTFLERKKRVIMPLLGESLDNAKPSNSVNPGTGIPSEAVLVQHV